MRRAVRRRVEVLWVSGVGLASRSGGRGISWWGEWGVSGRAFLGKWEWGGGGGGVRGLNRKG